MRNVMLIALLPALMLAAGITQPMTTIDREIAPAGNEAVVRVDRPNPPAEPYVLVGQVDTIGGTTYDWQTNGPIGRFLINSPDYGLHVAWMYSADQTTIFPDRNMRYNFYDYAAGGWNWIDPDFMQSGVNVFTEKTGYGTLEADPATGVAYVSGHLGTPIRPDLARDMAPGGGLFEYCAGTPNADGYLWPYMSASGNGKVHIACIDDASRGQLFYTKVDPWCTWMNPVGVAAPQPDPAFPTQNIAASKVSDNVAIAWEFSEGAPDPGFYRLSSDGGTTWANPEELPWPPAFGGDSQPSYHITSMHTFYDSDDELHILANVMPYVAGAGYIIPAELWHWSPANTPNWSEIYIATCDPANLLAAVGYNAMYACRMSMSEGANGMLYIAWEQFDSSNVEPGPPEFIRADIFCAASGDNGVTWTDPLKLTEGGTGSHRFPSIVDHSIDMGGEEYIAVTYEIDQQAGFFVQGEGPATNNPVIVHWVPTSAIGVAEPGQGAKPSRLEIAARPNPFGNRTRISYAVPHAGNVSLAVYDAAGRPVRTLVNARQGAGRYSVNWDGRDDLGNGVSAGIYFYTLATDQASTTEKLTVVR